MNHRMNKYLGISVIVAIVVIVAILTAIWASSTSFFPRFPFERRIPPLGKSRGHRVFLHGRRRDFHGQRDAFDNPSCPVHQHLQKDTIGIHDRIDNILSGLSPECSFLQSFCDLGFWFWAVRSGTVCLVARSIYTCSFNRAAVSELPLLGANR